MSIDVKHDCKTCFGTYGIGYTCPGCGQAGQSVDIYDRAAAVIADRDRLAAQLSIAQERIAGLESALTKISAIRDSIVGMQGFNFSEHAYPLVAALDAAGFKGAGYEIARQNLGALIEQRDTAEKARDEAIVLRDSADQAMDAMAKMLADSHEARVALGEQLTDARLIAGKATTQYEVADRLRELAETTLSKWQPVIEAAKAWHVTMTERNGDYENNAPTHEQYEAHDEAVRRLMESIDALPAEEVTSE